MDTPPPLRPEPTAGRRHLHRNPPLQSLNSDAFAIFFLIISLCFIFIVLISPFYNLFKPQFTRKSLDLLSLAMILFAIACGLMSKNNGENRAHEEIHTAPNTSSSNDSQLIHKSNPSLSFPNQWNGYADRTDRILHQRPPAVTGFENWKLSGGDCITSYQALNSDSVQHCRNLKDFEDGFHFKSGNFSVYDDEISSSSSALLQSSVPPLMTPPLFSSPPVINPPLHAVVEAELNGNCENPLLRLDFQELEDEKSKKDKHKSKGNKKNKKKNKVKKWEKGIGNSSPPPAPPPLPSHTVAVHHHRASSKIGEMRRDFPPPPPQSPPQMTNAPRTHRNSSGGEPPSAAELETEKTKIGMFCGSPDVNSKADNFIERFREGLKLEMMNSVKERQMRTRASILGRKGPEQ